MRALVRADELKAKGVRSIEHLQSQEYYTVLCGETAAAAAIEDGPGESQLGPDIDVVGVLMDARSEASADGSNRSHRVGESQDEGEGEDGDEASEQKSEAENEREGEIGDEKIDNDGIPGEMGG